MSELKRYDSREIQDSNPAQWYNADEADEMIQHLLSDLKEHDDLFELRWKADQRGIKMWQESHPDKKLTWPDRADMVQFLMERVDEVGPS